MTRKRREDGTYAVVDIPYCLESFLREKVLLSKDAAHHWQISMFSSTRNLVWQHVNSDPPSTPRKNGAHCPDPGIL